MGFSDDSSIVSTIWEIFTSGIYYTDIFCSLTSLKVQMVSGIHKGLMGCAFWGTTTSIWPQNIVNCGLEAEIFS